MLLVHLYLCIAIGYDLPMNSNTTTCLLFAAVALTQQTVVQLKNWLLSAATLSFFALGVNFNVDRHTPNQTIHDISQPRIVYPLHSGSGEKIIAFTKL